MSELSNDDQKIWEKLNSSHILNDNFVKNEFHKRNLKLHDIDEVNLTFSPSGKVHCTGHLSTESHSCEIAIMKLLIKFDIKKITDKSSVHKS